MHPPTLLLAIFLAGLTIMIPRKYFLVPYILAVCFVPSDQRIIIGQFDFTVLRLLVGAGVLRILLRAEQRRLSLNTIDRLLLMWVFCGAAVYIIQWKNTEAVINRAGFLFDAVGLYWLFRQNIRSGSDVKRMFRLFAFCAIISLPFILLEWSTGSNPFVIFGRVVTSVRGERFRCQGAFPHSIMMGLFWAVLAPMFVALARTEKSKILYWAAFISSLAIVIVSASSSPLLVLLLALAAFYAFNWRRHSASIAWAIVAVTAALHIVMNAPVWHLIARVNIVGGSTGWHRYNLIDKAIRNFNEWMVLGCRSTKHWGFGLEDVTNQYVLEGVRGGAITLLIFLIMIYATLKLLVNSSLRYRGRREQLLIWGLVSMMIAHCVGFIGASYFGQISVLWYMTLAAASLFAEHQLFLKRAAKKDYAFVPNLAV